MGLGTAASRCGRRSRTAAAGRSGTGSSCRTPRRPRTASAAARGPRRTHGRRRSRRTRSRCGRPASRSASNSYGVSRRSGRQEAAGRAADEDGLERAAAGAAGEAARARAAASPAGPRRCRRPRDRAAGRGPCRGWPSAPIAANAAPPFAHDPRDGGQGLDVVDDGGPVEQAALGGVRRALLGLAALALEGLEQDGLLAQHVGALDGPDRRPSRGGRSRATSSPRKPASSAARTAPSSSVTSAGVVGADGEDRLGRADRERGDREPLDARPTGRRPAGPRPCGPPGPRRSRWRRRSAGPAGWRCGRAPLLAGGEARAAAARGARRRRSWRSCPSAPRSRTARPQPLERAGAGRRRRGRPGRPRGRATRPVRTAGQSPGVVRKRAHQLARAAVAERGVERGAVRRLVGDGAPRPPRAASTDRRLEAQVAVVATRCRRSSRTTRR